MLLEWHSSKTSDSKVHNQATSHGCIFPYSPLKYSINSIKESAEIMFALIQKTNERNILLMINLEICNFKNKQENKTP